MAIEKFENIFVSKTMRRVMCAVYSNCATVRDAIFPSFCIGCNREGNILCAPCLAALEPSGVFCCPICHAHTRTGEPCSDRCAQRCPIVRHVALLPLTEHARIHEMIHLYKYEYIESLESSFASLIERFFSTHHVSGIDVVIPVPLHRKRFMERGFNQSEYFARCVSRVTGIPFLDPLKRTVNTPKQATLDRQGRSVNVAGVFTVTPECVSLMQRKNILIVDDVFTTGSTIFECARAVRDHGAGSVSGLSIARG